MATLDHVGYSTDSARAFFGLFTSAGHVRAGRETRRPKRPRRQLVVVLETAAAVGVVLHPLCHP